MVEHFTLLHLYFVIGSLAIVIPITYGFMSDYKRDHKHLISSAIIIVIILLLVYISDFVLDIISRAQ